MRRLYCTEAGLILGYLIGKSVLYSCKSKQMYTWTDQVTCFKHIYVGHDSPALSLSRARFSSDGQLQHERADMKSARFILPAMMNCR